MQRSDMTCAACINFEDGLCHLYPIALKILSPSAHWCSKGAWLRWSDRFLDHERFYWGEWETRIGFDMMNVN